MSLNTATSIQSNQPPSCPFVQRIWSILEHKRIPYQYIEINPYNKDPSFLALNPRGLVPTLEVQSRNGHPKPLYESTVLAEFLDEAYPDTGPRLLPEDPYERARARIWVGFCTSKLVPAWHRFLQFQPASDREGLEKVRGEFVGVLREFAAELPAAGKGPFFHGAQPGMVDFVVAPWVVRLWVFEHFKGGLEVPREGEGGVWERFAAWKEAVEDLRSVRETLSEREYYLPIYQRYADDTAQSEMAKASRAGKAVP